MAALSHILRDGAFLDRARIRLWTIAILIGFALAIAYLFATAHGVNDYDGRPLGTDFSDVYAAGTLANDGHAERAFDPAQHFAREKALFGNDTQFYGWHYPPFFLLVAAPLAHLPYLPALIVWQLASLAFYLLALRLLLRDVSDKTWLLVALAFPATFVNLTHGHNGFLTAGLIATALALLDKRPPIAGLCFGLLAYKPQFGVMIPLVLAVTGRWRSFAAAAATVAALALAVTALFGEAVWPAFLAGTHFTRTVVLEQGNTGFHKIQTVFAWARMWGASVPLAYIAQAFASLGVAAALTLLWRSRASTAVKGASLCLGMLLSTPYALDYDMMALAPAIAMLAAEGLREGFRPYERVMLLALWAVPILARGFAEITHIPLGVPVMAAAFVALFATLARGGSTAIVRRTEIPA
ncbi:MAG TPA: glycosyltransferase family 87 protein [Rhizomicrobium sp.]|nr:glycosyltransferase family 87 protein [Rhizomicrobium sp.]